MIRRNLSLINEKKSACRQELVGGLTRKENRIYDDIRIESLFRVIPSFFM